MENITLINYMKDEYNRELPNFRKMRAYYDGDHDITHVFHFREGFYDSAFPTNWVCKFVDEEVGYALNNPVSYIHKNGDKDTIDAIYRNYEHFELNHDQKLMRALEIYGICFCLYYVDSKGRFCERILNPTNAIAYWDEEEVVQRFIHFYRKKYEENQYYDVYYPDGTVEVYKDDSLIEVKNHYFKSVPVHVCKIELSETIYSKVKALNDAYDELLSNQQSLISEYKNAVLGLCGTEEQVKMAAKALAEGAGILMYPNSNAKPSWIIKDINDTAIQNQMQEIKENLYAQSNHIDWNEKLSSNLSGVALQSRLIGLDQRVNMVLAPVRNALYSRVYYLFEYLELLNQSYDASAIRIVANIAIPTDTSSRVNEVVQLGDIISHQSKLERLPFIENTALEMKRIQEERETEKSIDLNKIEDPFTDDGSES